MDIDMKFWRVKYRPLINFMKRDPSWDAESPQLIKTVPIFYGTNKSTSLFKRDGHWSLSWARWIQSTTLHPTFSIYILVLSSIYVQDFQVVFAFSFSNQNIICILFFFSESTCPSQLILLRLITFVKSSDINGNNINSTQWKIRFGIRSFSHPYKLMHYELSQSKHGL
jgi:hypothetical protein